MKIAVLDDDNIQLQLVQRALLSDEAEWDEMPICSFYESGEELLEAVKNEAFDLVILDRKVPDMSGDVILQWLRQFGVDKHGVYTVVIMLTSLQSEQNEMYAYKIGADEYIIKPFTPAKLIVRIKRLLELRSSKTLLDFEKYKDNNVIIESTKLLLDDDHGYKFIDQDKVVVLKTGEHVILNEIEYTLAKHIFDNLGVPLAREEVFDKIWRNSQLGLRLVDTYVHRLCVKLRLNLNNGFSLKTIYGFGFRMDFRPVYQETVFGVRKIN